jgi:hypothetical protein
MLNKKIKYWLKGKGKATEFCNRLRIRNFFSYTSTGYGITGMKKWP